MNESCFGNVDDKLKEALIKWTFQQQSISNLTEIEPGGSFSVNLFK